MAKANVDILVNARDRTKRVFMRMRDQLSRVNAQLRKMRVVTVAAAAAYLGFQKAKALMGDMLQAWAVQEDAQQDLRHALEATGQAVDELLPKYMQFTSELQNATNVGDELTLKLMAQATTMGVSETQLINVTKAAVALHDVYGMGLNESLKKVVRATQGQVNSLGELFPEILKAETQAEKLAIANERMAQTFEVAQRGTTTSAGALQSFQNNFGDVMEQMGRLLAPMLKMAADVFGKIAAYLQQTAGQWVPFMQMVAKTIANVLQWTVSETTKLFTMLQVGAENAAEVYELIGQSIVAYGEKIQAWMLRIGGAIAGFVVQLAKNVGPAIHNIFAGVMNAIKWVYDGIMELLGLTEKVATWDYSEFQKLPGLSMPDVGITTPGWDEGPAARRARELAESLSSRFFDKWDERKSTINSLFDAVEMPDLGNLEIGFEEGVKLDKDDLSSVFGDLGSQQRSRDVGELSAALSRTLIRGRRAEADDEAVKAQRANNEILKNVGKVLAKIEKNTANRNFRVINNF